MHKIIKLFSIIGLALLSLHSSGQSPQVVLHILGIMQDAGLPQLGCAQKCCQQQDRHSPRIPVVSLGITQPDPAQCLLIEASPDIITQWQALTQLNNHLEPSSIVLTHAHMGHYSGLLQLGREARNTKEVNVYGSPRMISFLENNQPWKQLVELRNINPNHLAPGLDLSIGKLNITAIPVPHRDEISDTYAYLLKGPAKTALFLPDIDKWEKWPVSIDSLIHTVDYAFIDATFFDASEVPGRNLAEIPHPTVKETMQRASTWPAAQRNKVYLIHFNHTNPLLDPDSRERALVEQFGFRIAHIGEQINL
jgi:pyrroloquinoline quinone biosynthesis protein B